MLGLSKLWDLLHATTRSILQKVSQQDSGMNRTGQQAQEIPAQKIPTRQKAFSMVGFDQNLFSSFDSYFIC